MRLAAALRQLERGGPVGDWISVGLGMSPFFLSLYYLPLECVSKGLFITCP